MKRTPWIASAGAVLVGVFFSPGAALGQRTSTIPLTACNPPRVTGAALCGTYQVFENRDLGSGRKIALTILVLPATDGNHAPDPIFFISGGPGSSIIAQAAGLAQDPSGLRAHRDFVLVDQRGTGASHPLTCTFYGPSDSIQSYLGEFLPADDVRKCRDEFAQTTDLTQYTTTIAMDDLDEVRQAMGYEKINLVGYSYGTRATLQYLRQHGEHARTATVYGLAPATMYMPLHFARDAERSLQGVLSECLVDSKCKEAFPDIRNEATRVFESLLHAPAQAEVGIPRNNGPTTVRVTHDIVAETVRYMLYDSESAALVPLALHAAARGDYHWVARQALSARGGLRGRGTFDGLYIAITCAEDLPWVDEQAGVEEAKGTFLGGYRVIEQKRSCSIWPRSPIPRNYHEPVHSEVPTLLFSGALDPVTPAAQGEEVARSLPNSLHVVVPHGGHGYEGLEGTECLDRLWRAFVEQGSARGLDSDCVRAIRRKGFPTSYSPS